jgi:hypothetical protein
VCFYLLYCAIWIDRLKLDIFSFWFYHFWMSNYSDFHFSVSPVKKKEMIWMFFRPFSSLSAPSPLCGRSARSLSLLSLYSTQPILHTWMLIGWPATHPYRLRAQVLFPVRQMFDGMLHSSESDYLGRATSRGRCSTEFRGSCYMGRVHQGRNGGAGWWRHFRQFIWSSMISSLVKEFSSDDCWK